MFKTIQKVKSLAALLVIAVAMVVAALPSTVSAANGNPSYCDNSLPALTNKNIGKNVPVILAHGLTGKPNDWGKLSAPTSFAARINSIPGVKVAQLYEYNSLEWVTQPSGGPKMAKTIDCLSQLSKANGGKGKVVVVGYSMGGLVARAAVNETAYDGSSIGSKMGQVITIGTPHAGALGVAGLAGWFTPGSDEMEALPDFSSYTQVHTIAGDVTRVNRNFWNGSVQRVQPYDDTVVSTNSANAAYTIDANKGGGSKTISCDKYYITGLGAPYDTGRASCQHEELLNNAFNGVRPDTIAAIKKYVAWLNTPTPAISLTIDGVSEDLTTQYDGNWKNAQYGASGVGQDLFADEVTDIGWVQIFNMNWCQAATMLECTASDIDPSRPAPAVTVGGRSPDTSARYSGVGSSLAWCFEAEKICIAYRGSDHDAQTMPSQPLLDVFSTATWTPRAN